MEKEDFDIWVEGYLVTGMEGIPAKAQLIATGVEGKDFNDAVTRWYNSNPENASKYGSLYFTKSGNPCLWGCCLFDNETDARKSFG